jgi:hypothetical protein
VKVRDLAIVAWMLHERDAGRDTKAMDDDLEVESVVVMVTIANRRSCDLIGGMLERMLVRKSFRWRIQDTEREIDNSYKNDG